MRHALTLLFTLSVATPAIAWDVGHFRDRMTDRQETFATVSSGNAQLYVGCMNGDVQPRLSFPSRIGNGRVGVSYRFDDGPVTPRFVLASGDSLYLWPMDYAEALAKLKHGKRLRVEVGKAFFDFDLTGGASLPEIKCAP